MGWTRWRRVASPGACPYCLMLATRGAIYKNQGTALRSSHGNDRCGVAVEGNFDRRDDIAIDPADAARRIVYRHRKYGEYEYDLSQYRVMGVTEAPKARPPQTPRGGDAPMTVRLPEVPGTTDSGSGRGAPPPRAGFRLGEGDRPAYDELVAEPGRVAPSEDRDRYYEFDAERLTARYLADHLGLVLRSVRAAHAAEGRKMPDSVCDEHMVTIEMKHPELLHYRAIKWRIADGRHQSANLVIDTRPQEWAQAEAVSVVARAMGSNNVASHVDSILVIGNHEGVDWHYWAKGHLP